jgi:hypothetical protein
MFFEKQFWSQVRPAVKIGVTSPDMREMQVRILPRGTARVVEMARHLKIPLSLIPRLTGFETELRRVPVRK